MKTYVSAIKMSGTEKVLLSLCAGPEKQQSPALFSIHTEQIHHHTQISRRGKYHLAHYSCKKKATKDLKK